MEEIKIEKNVPFFKTKREKKYPFDEMDIGDSFLFKPKDELIEKGRSYILMAANYYKKKRNKHDLKFKTAIENGNVRIWRVK